MASEGSRLRVAYQVMSGFMHAFPFFVYSNLLTEVVVDVEFSHLNAVVVIRSINSYVKIY